ncbi:MAG: hypothetical protein AseanaTS_00480 [Candidatus Pelagadaptatus aseana]|uniref:diguanylate cyclase domain-containing protein n=1 Tax=Candidatus Pelagadaptatus aseana TaxID=3120508 RepID=UPI0039B2A32A
MSARQMTILIIEDSSTVQRTMEKGLASLGYTLVFSSSGEEGLQYLDQHSVDMIFLDVEMPGINGFETARIIRSRLDSQWVPIVMLTSNASDESYEKGIDSGCDDYLIKPISYGVLRAKIKAFMRIVKMHRRLLHEYQDLQTLSARDGLTGCFNREYFSDRADEYLSGTPENHSAILIDIDYFKKYNDTYGHLIGDECLKQVAKAIMQSARHDGDVVCRYGGEEFALFLSNTDLESARVVAQRICRNVAALAIPHKASEVADCVTISVGIFSNQQSRLTSLKPILSAADAALYEAKAKGRNQIIGLDAQPLSALVVLTQSPGNFKSLLKTVKHNFDLLFLDDLADLGEIADEIHFKILIVDSAFSARLRTNQVILNKLETLSVSVVFSDPAGVVAEVHDFDETARADFGGQPLESSIRALAG